MLLLELFGNNKLLVLITETVFGTLLQPRHRRIQGRKSQQVRPTAVAPVALYEDNVK